MTALRVGIAGCGMIAGGPVRGDRPILGNHAQACRDLGLVLAAAADPDAARREKFARYWSPESSWADALEMIRAAQLDLLIVATPPETHEAICLAAVAAGIRGILCEKPFTGHAPSAERVRAACEEAAIPLVVNFSRRWDESHQELRRALGAGELGEPRLVTGCYTGTLRGNGSHLVDTVRMLCPGDWTLEWTSQLRGDDGPVALAMRAGAAQALLAPVGDAEYFVFELDVSCTRGRARLFNNGNEIHLERPQSSVEFPGYRYLQRSASLPEGTLPRSFTRALDELCRAVAERRVASVPPIELIQSLALIDAVMARAQQREETIS
jgi:predicted dehydrogenase